MQEKSFDGVKKIAKMLLVLPLCSLANIPLTPETARDQERRIRREIANSNERRRMQSINAGFQSLKTLIPHSDGEKLSKVRFKRRDPISCTKAGNRPSRHALSFSPPPGCHPAADGRIHFHSGAGEDAAIAAEQPAQKNHTSKVSPDSKSTNQPVGLQSPEPALIAKSVSLSVGVERLVAQEEARGREGRGDRLPGHPGGGEDRRSEEGDDRVAAAAGERTLGEDDTGGSGEGEAD